MAESTNETELTQSFEQEEIDKEDENKPKILNSAEILQQHIETVDEEILAHEDIGNWCDVLENDLPTVCFLNRNLTGIRNPFSARKWSS